MNAMEVSLKNIQEWIRARTPPIEDKQDDANRPVGERTEIGQIAQR